MSISKSAKKEGVKANPSPVNKTEKLETESPISEKDEVKKAEDKMNKRIKKK